MTNYPDTKYNEEPRFLETTIRRTFSLKAEVLQSYLTNPASAYFEANTGLPLSKPLLVQNSGTLVATTNDDPRFQSFIFYDNNFSAKFLPIHTDPEHGVDIYGEQCARELYSLAENFVVLSTQSGELFMYIINGDLANSSNSSLTKIGALNYLQGKGQKGSIMDFAVNPKYPSVYAVSTLHQNLHVNDYINEKPVYFQHHDVGHVQALLWDDYDATSLFSVVHRTQGSETLSEIQKRDLRVSDREPPSLSMIGLPECHAFSMAQFDQNLLGVGFNQNIMAIYDVRMGKPTQLIVDNNVDVIGDMEFNHNKTELLTCGTGGWTRWKLSQGTSDLLTEYSHSDRIENEDNYSTTGRFFNAFDAVITDCDGFITYDSSQQQYARPLIKETNLQMEITEM